MQRSNDDLDPGTRLRYRIVLCLVLFVVLHLVPVPHPTRPIKSPLPDSHWESLAIFEPPYHFGWLWLTELAGCVRHPSVVLPIYETLVVLAACLLGLWLPLHWFHGRP